MQEGDKLHIQVQIDALKERVRIGFANYITQSVDEFARYVAEEIKAFDLESVVRQQVREHLENIARWSVSNIVRPAMEDARQKMEREVYRRVSEDLARMRKETGA